MGAPYIPIEYSRLQAVETAYQSNDDVIAFGLGPCSKAIEVFGRHQNQCWGNFPSKWLLQKDASANCVFEDKVSQLNAYYTNPRTNNLTTISGITPMQQKSVKSQSQQQPSCFPGGVSHMNSYYAGLTQPQ